MNDRDEDRTPAVCGYSSAAAQALAHRGVFLHIVSYQSGLPRFVLDYERRNEGHRTTQLMHGLLPCLAMDQGDYAMLLRLYRVYEDQKRASFKCPWPEIDWRINFDAVMSHAVGRRDLPALQWLHVNTTVACNPRTLVCAASLGYLDVVQWLALNCKEACASIHCSPCDAMMLHGDLQLVQFMVTRFPGLVLTTAAMDYAAAQGHLELLRYLHEHRIEGCSVNAMDGAARSGRLDIVRFLHENRTEGCTHLAMDSAAANGHLEIVEYLHFHRREGCTSAAMDDAAKNGHLDVVKFLHAHRTEGCSIYAMDLAAWNGQLEVLQFLKANRSEGCTPMAIVRAAERGHLHVVRFLHAGESCGSNCHEDAIVEAARSGHVAVVRFLVENCTRGCLVVARTVAEDYNQTQVATYLDHHIPKAVAGCGLHRHAIDGGHRPCQTESAAPAC